MRAPGLVISILGWLSERLPTRKDARASLMNTTRSWLMFYSSKPREKGSLLGRAAERANGTELHEVQKPLSPLCASSLADGSLSTGDSPTQCFRGVQLDMRTAGILVASPPQLFSKETAGCRWRCKKTNFNLASPLWSLVFALYLYSKEKAS